MHTVQLLLLLLLLLRAREGCVSGAYAQGGPSYGRGGARQPAMLPAALQPQHYAQALPLPPPPHTHPC
jgi:hypothetical protein